MAQRSVYETLSTAPFYREKLVTFEYNPGFAISQKQKNIVNLHESYLNDNPGKSILEISSKALDKKGIDLSAFNLLIKTNKGDYPLESMFQASKVFEKGGPFTDLLSATPLEAKRDPRLRASGNLIRFSFYNKSFPSTPKTFFYDWLYINTLIQNPEKAKILTEFNAFTDIEFNPNKSINCQAKSAAIFSSLAKNGYITENSISPEAFSTVVYPDFAPEPPGSLF